MATGSSNLSGIRIDGVLDYFGIPKSSNIKEGYVVVYTSDSGDNNTVDVPTAATALLGGKAYAGINKAQGTTTYSTSTLPSDNQIPVQLKGIAKCALKANTACTRGQRCGYDPADGGPVQPILPNTSGRLVDIGRFVQTKSSSASEQFVGVELDQAGAASNSELLVYGIVADGTHTTNVATEQTFTTGTYSIAANTLLAGSVIKIKGNILVENQNGTDKLVVKIKIGSNVLVSTPATYDPATNDVVNFEALVKVRTAGAGGTMIGQGTLFFGAAAPTAAQGSLASTALDTTAANTVSASVTFDAASANNVCKLRAFDVSVIGS